MTLAAATLPLWWGGYLLLVYPPSLVEYAAGAAVGIIASGCTAAVALVTARRWRRPPPKTCLQGRASAPKTCLQGRASAPKTCLQGRASTQLLRTLTGLPWRLLRGYLRVVGAGLAPRRGAVRGQLRRECATGIGWRDLAGAGRRAWTGWARSLAADELVVGFPSEDTIVVHVLPAAGGDRR